MNTSVITSALTTLLSELLHGPATDNAFMLNGGDVGLFRSLDELSSSQASEATTGSATVAAHTDHLRYGLSLMNRWSAGENPFTDADWTKSWRIGAVSDAEWKASRDGLRAEGQRWLDTIAVPREVNDIELNGMIGSIAHIGYHLGAIRQIQRAARGPSADASA